MSLEGAKNEIDHAFTREDPRGQSYENAFGGAVSFLRRRYTKDLTDYDLCSLGCHAGWRCHPEPVEGRHLSLTFGSRLNRRDTVSSAV